MIDVLIAESSSSAQEALLSRLKPLRDAWNMQYVIGTAAAQSALEAQRFDVVISDIGSAAGGATLDGIALLRDVRDRWPATVRLILSAQTSQDSVMKALPVAHQILAKPFDLTHLSRIVARACTLQAKLYSNGVMASLGSLKSLPAVPRLYQQLTQDLDSGRATPKSVASIIEQDMSMTLRLLQLVNSAFFGLARRITNIREAVTYLGFEPIRHLVASAELFRAMSKICAPAGFSLEEVQRHSQRVGMTAATLLTDRELSRTAYCAGMLHDIGQVILAVSMPEAYARAIDLSKRMGIRQHIAEQQIFACTHAEIGAHVLALWGLPPSLVEAVAFHHQPAALGEAQLGLTGAIHVADAMEHARLDGMSPSNPTPVLKRIDQDWIEAIGQRQALDGWIAGYESAAAA